MATPAGKLRERFAFSSPVSASDGYGGVTDGFQDQFTLWARRRFLRGSEAVQAARLEGRQPAILTVRRSSQSEQIGTDWRATDTRTGAVFNIRSFEPSEDHASIDMLVEAGVAV